MNTRSLLVTILAVALSVAPQLVSTSNAAGGFSARLISPSLGQVLHPGEQITVEWQSTLPKTGAGGCEMELFLSVDGGRTFTMCITPHINPHTTSFNWTVPNLPTNAAVLEICFGCEWFYPESFSPQPAATFVIAKAAPTLQ